MNWIYILIGIVVFIGILAYGKHIAKNDSFLNGKWDPDPNTRLH